MAKDKNLFSGQEMIVQTRWPHIIGRMRKFSSTESEELMRTEWVRRIENGAPIVCSSTYRVYVELAGTLQGVSSRRIEAVTHTPIEAYIHDILCSMAEYAASQLREKQRYAYSWERNIVPDDFFLNQRKLRKQIERQNETTETV